MLKLSGGNYQLLCHSARGYGKVVMSGKLVVTTQPTLHALSLQEVRALQTQSHKPSRKKKGSRLMIYANDVPVFAKLNPHKSIAEIFEKLWQRTSQNTYQIAVSSAKKDEALPENKDERIARLAKEANVEQMVEQVKEIGLKAKNVEELQATDRIVQNVVNKAKNLGHKEKKEVIKEVKHAVRKVYGKQAEQQSITHYEKISKATLVNQNKLYTKVEAKAGSHTVVLAGRIDAMRDGIVVEVKNRIYTLPDTLPPYDVAQLQTYLHILNATEGELVEHLQKKNQNFRNTRVTRIARDLAQWNDLLLPSLMSVAHIMDRFLADETLHQEFLRANLNDRDLLLEVIREKNQLPFIPNTSRWALERLTPGKVEKEAVNPQPQPGQAHGMKRKSPTVSSETVKHQKVPTKVEASDHRSTNPDANASVAARTEALHPDL